MRPSKPTFQNVVDLGLRDVGVKNDPRRLAAHLGKISVPLAVLFVVFVVAACALVRWTGAGRWLVIAFAVVWTAGVIAAGLRAGRRSPVVVVKVTAEGGNHAAWLMLVHLLLVVVGAAVVMEALLIEPHLDDPAAVADFVADKDREHSRLAGFRVTHTERVVDGRKGYVWNHGSRRGFWYYAAWFPQPVHTVRVECIARRQEGHFRRLCSEAIRSLEFR